LRAGARDAPRDAYDGGQPVNTSGASKKSSSSWTQLARLLLEVWGPFSDSQGLMSGAKNVDMYSVRCPTRARKRPENRCLNQQMSASLRQAVIVTLIASLFVSLATAAYVWKVTRIGPLPTVGPSPFSVWCKPCHFLS